MARADQGLLAEDWLANTADPTPAFSTLVAFTVRYLHPWAYHIYYALLLGAYAAAMLGLFAYLAGPGNASRWPVFLALFVTAHAAAFRWLSYRLVGFDYPWFLQAGVAGQYVLGPMLQPSAFGVLLVVAICLFAHGRPYLAALCVGAAADMHSTYLLPGAFITLGFLTALLMERRIREAAGVGALTLALVLPTVAYVALRFGPTSPESFAEAKDVLVNLRIPHHCRIDLWLDPVAGGQIAWVVLALALVWKTRLFPTLAVPVALAALLSAAQAATGSDTLALLFPWRISAILVPVATTIILSRLGLLPVLPLASRVAKVVSLFAVAVLVVAGIWISVGQHAFRVNDDERALLDYVRAHRAAGDVYLLPVRVPPLVRNTRGSLSSDFKPLAEKRDGTVIPVDLQSFRLHAGAPIYVDFKSIPYKDVDVIEWRDRLRRAESLQGRLNQPGTRDELRRLGITHVVTATSSPPIHGVEAIHEDAAYRLYQLKAAR